VIADFDGTIARLPVDWQALREAFHVSSIEEVLETFDQSEWDRLKRAEVAAAEVAEPMMKTVSFLNESEGYVILTNNDVAAVTNFLTRFASSLARPRRIIDRNVLGGSKKNFEKFSAAVLQCSDSLDARKSEEVTYLGDSTYELDYADALGFKTILVDKNGNLINYRGN